VGAGAGASVGKIHGIARAMRGGIGSASVRLGEIVVGALVAVNAIGDVRDPETGALVAGTRDAAEGRRLVDSARELLAGAALGRFAAPGHTTIGVVATNAPLDRAGAAPHGLRRRHALRALARRPPRRSHPPRPRRGRRGRPRDLPRRARRNVPPRPARRRRPPASPRADGMRRSALPVLALLLSACTLVPWWASVNRD